MHCATLCVHMTIDFSELEDKVSSFVNGFFTGLTGAAEGFSVEWKTGANHIRGSDLCGWACVKWPLQPCRTPGHPVRVGCCKNKFHDVASRARRMLQDNEER